MSKNNNYKLNILYAYIIHFTMAFSYGWAVVKILFYENIGLSFSEISILLSFGPVIALLVEIPTGIFSDFFGRKISIITSFILSFLAALFLLNADSFIHLAIASSLYGLSWGFWSGSYESFVYESCLHSGKKKHYDKVLTKTNFIYTSLSVLTNYTYPILFKTNNDILFLTKDRKNSPTSK